METPKTTICYPIEFGLRLIGAWPKSSQFFTILQRTLCIHVIGISISFQLWYIISYLKSADLPDLLDAMSVTLSNIAVFFKIIIIWCNYRMFSNTLAIISDDWNNCALSNHYKQLMMDKVNLSSRISISVVSVFVMSCIFYLMTTLFISDDTGEELPSNNRKLLIKMRLPFDVQISPMYEICIAMQFVLQNFAAFTAAMFMALFAALALHVGGQINIMCQSLLEFSIDDEETTRKELKNLVIKHQRIIHLSDKIKYVFSYITFVQFFTNVLVICFLGFVTVTSLGTENQFTILAKCFPYCLAVNCEAFIFCYTGEYLTSKSENINHAAYNTFWYKLHPREKRILLLLLIRSKKPLILTAGKIANLSLETFANMLKASVSYISVLLAMY